MVKNTNPRITILNFYGTKGWGFELLQAHQKSAKLADFFMSRGSSKIAQKTYKKTLFYPINAPKCE